jgi:glycosyltransferase involved in cell wall biosynthesis
MKNLKHDLAQIATLPKARVLHVTDCFAGGVKTAIMQYVRSTPNIEHHLLYSTKSDLDSENSPAGEFAYKERLSAGLFSGVRQIRNFTKINGYSVVHAHSSNAGAMVRLAMNSKQVKIVYSPHCFAFEMDSRLKPIYFLIEWILSLRTSTIAACSPRELMISRTWFRKPESLYVPHIFKFERPMNFPAGNNLKISMVGRLSKQKDPKHFQRIAQELSKWKSTLGFEFFWFGGGDFKSEGALTRSGVKVTGWLSQDDLIKELRDKDIYVHSAKWEGFPFAILDALSQGLPVFVRKRKSLTYLPEVCLFRNTRELKMKLLSLSSVEFQATYNNELRQFLAKNTSQEQISALSRIYETS